MIEIRKALKTYLKTLCPRVYYLQAPQDAIFPYLVYTLSVFSDGEGSELVDLEIDGWDSNTTQDTDVIETLMDKINGYKDENGDNSGLDKQTLSTDKVVVTFFLENKIGLTDDNKDLHRRKYSYSGQLININ